MASTDDFLIQSLVFVSTEFSSRTPLKQGYALYIMINEHYSVKSRAEERKMTGSWSTDGLKQKSPLLRA